jgi:hypothetical protein
VLFFAFGLLLPLLMEIREVIPVFLSGSTKVHGKLFAATASLLVLGEASCFATFLLMRGKSARSDKQPTHELVQHPAMRGKLRSGMAE